MSSDRYREGFSDGQVEGEEKGFHSRDDEVCGLAIEIDTLNDRVEGLQDQAADIHDKIVDLWNSV